MSCLCGCGCLYICISPPYLRPRPISIEMSQLHASMLLLVTEPLKREFEKVCYVQTLVLSLCESLIYSYLCIINTFRCTAHQYTSSAAAITTPTPATGAVQAVQAHTVGRYTKRICQLGRYVFEAFSPSSFPYQCYHLPTRTVHSILQPQHHWQILLPALSYHPHHSSLLVCSRQSLLTHRTSFLNH